MVFEVDVDFKVSGIKTRRMRGIDLRKCSTGLLSRDYPPESGDVGLRLRYTKGNYVYEVYAYIERIQYADAPPNPPVTPSGTRSTVRMSIEDVVAEVVYELKVFPMVGFNVNYPIMDVWYGFIEKNVEMGRYAERGAELGAANWLKPNPASVVV
jgi:hypothetical protein